MGGSGRRQETESRRQETEARRGNPDLVGMGVLVVGSFSISRILYLLDMYYTSCGVGCQGKSPISADAVLHEAWGLRLPALTPIEGSKNRKSQNHPSNPSRIRVTALVSSRSRASGSFPRTGILLPDALGGSPLVKDCLTKPNNVL
jgi:hypothetical protein